MIELSLSNLQNNQLYPTFTLYSFIKLLDEVTVLDI